MSVVVPARNEASHIEDCLRAILGQSYRHLEIIVVDGVSTDGTRAIVENVAEDADVPIRLINNPQRTIPHALNAAADDAQGAFLVRVDAHARVDRDYVETIVDHLGSGEWAAVGGRKVAAVDSPFAEAFAIAYASRIAGGSLYHFGTASTETDHVPFGAYPMFVVRAVGGWDPALLVNQDFEFDHRVREAGGRILFDPRLVVSWQPRDSTVEVAYQYLRYGEGKVKVLRKHPSSLRVRQLAAPAMIAGTAVLGIAALANRRSWVLAPYGMYVAAVGVGGLHAGRRAGAAPTVTMRVPLLLLTMHHAWGFGFWRAAIRPKAAARDRFRRNPGRRRAEGRA